MEREVILKTGFGRVLVVIVTSSDPDRTQGIEKREEDNWIEEFLAFLTIG